MFLRRLFLITAVALVCVPCSAAVISSSDAFLNGDDSRLDQPITLALDGVAVSSILDDLSSKTGVTMVAGLDGDDWSVRDRKIIAHVTDMKLSDLMRQLSVTLHFHWSRAGEGQKSTYRLWQDRKEREEEESLRSAGDSAQSSAAREKRENSLADMVNLGSLSSADAGSLKSGDPWRYVLATEPLGRDVADLMSNFPDARNAFVQGTEASFAVAELPPALQDTVKRIAEAYDSLVKSIGGSEDHSALFSRFDKLQVTINQRPANPAAARTDVVSQSMLGRISIGGFEIPLFDPSSPMGKALGKAIISLKGGAAKDKVGKQLQTDVADAVKVLEAAQPSTRDINSDPALRAKVKLFVGNANVALPTALKALALQTKLNVISDYFPSAPPVLEGGEKTVGQQLEVIRKAYGSNWTKAGTVLTFRDRDWFSKRAWAVPGPWMKYWSDRGKLNNGLLLDDLVRIGGLRDEQIDHTIMYDSQLVRLGAGEAARNRQILRFYASLTPEQCKLMASSKLDVSTLGDEQWTALKSALATKGAAYAAAQKGSQFIQLGQSGSEVIEYKFAYYPGANEPAVTFALSSGDVYKTSDEIILPEKVNEFKTEKF